MFAAIYTATWYAKNIIRHCILNLKGKMHVKFPYDILHFENGLYTTDGVLFFFLMEGGVKYIMCVVSALGRLL